MSNQATSETGLGLLANLRQALTGPRAISLTGCLILLPFSIFATLYTETDRFPNLVGPLILTAALTAVDALVLILADRTILRKRRVQPVPLVAVLGTYVVAALVRPLTSHSLSPFLDPTLPFPSVRIVASVLVVGIALGLMALILDGHDRRRQTLAELQLESDRLDAMRRYYAEQLEAEQQFLDEAVRLRLGPTFRQLEIQLQQALVDPTSQATHAAAAEVRSATVEVVRPLSHVLGQRTTRQREDLSRASQSVSVATRWRVLLRDTFLIRPFHPVLLPILLYGASIGEATKRFGFLAGLGTNIVDLFLLGLVIWVSSRIFTRERLLQLRPTVRVISVLMVFFVASVLGNLLTQPLWRLSGQLDWTFFWMGNVFTVVGGFVLAMVSAMQAGRARAVLALRAAVAAERWEVEYLQRELELLSNRAGRRLHGSVQSQLSVLALTMDATAESSSTTAEQRANVIHNALDVLRMLSEEVEQLYVPTRERHLIEALENLRQVWAQVVAVQIVLGESVENIADQQGLTSALIELAREAIQNCAKHGSASAIWIDISAEQFGLIFQADDNGVGPTDRSSPGLGLSQVSADGYDWTLDAGPRGGARLTIKIPVFSSVTALD